MNIVEPWRLKNQDQKRFTWHRSEGNRSWSRIDYFLISEALVGWSDNCEIKPSILTDHSLITLNICPVETKRGPGLWKINNTILKDEEFCTNIREKIALIDRNFQHLDIVNRWELLKFELINEARYYSNEKGKQEKIRRFNLYKLLGEMQEEWMINPDDKDIVENMPRVKSEIDYYLNEDAKRSAFRCKSRFYEEGNKMTKYFLNLERRNYVSKTMYQVRKKDGTLTKDYSEILNEQFNFYKDLYAYDPSIEFTLKNETNCRVSREDKTLLDSEIQEGRFSTRL